MLNSCPRDGFFAFRHCEIYSKIRKDPGWTLIRTWATDMLLQQRRLIVSWAALSKVYPVSWGRWSFPSIQHWWGHIWSATFSPELLTMRKTPEDWRHHNQEPQKEVGTFLWGNSETAGIVWPKKRSFTGISLMGRNSWKEGAKRMELDPFQGCQVTEPEADWNVRSALWTSGNSFNVRMTKNWSRLS